MANALQRARARLTGRPATATNAGAGAAPLAEFLGPQVPRNLNEREFTAAQQVPNFASAFAAFLVPRGDVHQLLVGRPLRAYFGAVVRVTIDTEAAQTTGVADLGDLGLGLVRSTRAAPSFPTQAHPDVRAFLVTAGSPETLAAINVTAVDFDAGEVSVAGLTAEAANVVEIHYLPSRGTLRFRAEQPTGQDQRTEALYNDTFRSLHETDQASGVTAPKIIRVGTVGLPLGPKWRLVLEATTPSVIPWGESISPLTELVLPGLRAPIVSRDEAALGRVLSATLRNA